MRVVVSLQESLTLVLIPNTRPRHSHYLAYERTKNLGTTENHAERTERPHFHD